MQLYEELTWAMAAGLPPAQGVAAAVVGQRLQWQQQMPAAAAATLNSIRRLQQVPLCYQRRQVTVASLSGGEWHPAWRRREAHPTADYCIAG